MTHTYTVKGRWPFPTDMLRHDQSQAATSKDQELIDLLSQDHAPDLETMHTEYEITLTGPSKPNTARWESFTWTIPGDRDYQILKGIREKRQSDEDLYQAALAKLTPEERRVVEDLVRRHAMH